MSNTPNPAERGRFSSPRKTAAVLRLLRGEDLELLSRELGITAATLSGWRDDFLAGGQAAMWGTDMTTTVTTGEGQVCVFVAVDHCTAECIGIHASKSGNRFEALEPLRQGVREHFGGFDQGIAAGLAIRHDHGSAYMSDDFQQELAFLGMTSSPSFVREPEGNGVAERFIRTLKENLLWVRPFATVAELVEALREFRRRYNEQWLIERHGYRTPSQARSDACRGSKPLETEGEVP